MLEKEHHSIEEAILLHSRNIGEAQGGRATWVHRRQAYRKRIAAATDIPRRQKGDTTPRPP